MKNLLILMAIALVMASCAKDPNLVTNEALEGTWDITSYTFDGEEAYGPDGLFNDGFVTYTKVEDFTGKASTTMTVFPGSELESTQSGNFTYEISNEGSTLTITDSDGAKTVASITIEETTYTLEYMEDDANVVQKAKKR